jgi:hypothetical protein
MKGAARDVPFEIRDQPPRPEKFTVVFAAFVTVSHRGALIQSCLWRIRDRGTPTPPVPLFPAQGIRWLVDHCFDIRVYTYCSGCGGLRSLQ